MLTPFSGISARQTFENIGVNNLYKGIGVTFLRDIPYSAIFFPTYDFFKRTFSRGPDVSLLACLAAGFFATIPAAGLTTPADVIKTRIQAKDSNYTTIRNTAKRIYKEEG